MLADITAVEADALVAEFADAVDDLFAAPAAAAADGAVVDAGFFDGGAPVAEAAAGGGDEGVGGLIHGFGGEVGTQFFEFTDFADDFGFIPGAVAVDFFGFEAGGFEGGFPGAEVVGPDGGVNHGVVAAEHHGAKGQIDTLAVEFLDFGDDDFFAPMLVFADGFVGNAGGVDGFFPVAEIADAGGEEFLEIFADVMGIEGLSGGVPGTDFSLDEVFGPFAVFTGAGGAVHDVWVFRG